MRFTVLFDPPYWVGVLEVERDGLLYAARHIFGAEPSEQEVYEFVQRDLLKLQSRMTLGVPLDDTRPEHKNPKRVQREVKREMLEVGPSTRAWDAMRRQIEANKREAAREGKQQLEATKAYKRRISQAKAKARHRGR